MLLQCSYGLPTDGGGGQIPDDTVSPGSQVGLELVPVHVPKDSMERGCTGGDMGEAEGRREACAVIASPFGYGTRVASPTEHRTTRQREDGRERMALATRLPKVGDRREHCNERPWMCYHQALPVERVVAQVGDARKAKPHLAHNPLSPRWHGLATCPRWCTTVSQDREV